LSTTCFIKTGNLRRRWRGGLEEVNLQERLEIQVGHLLLVGHAQQLGELGVRHNAALERGVKAAVGLHVRGHELGDIRLAALRLGGQTHETGQLVGDGAELQERVVGAAGIVSRTLLRAHRGRVATNTALGLAGLTLDGLGCVGRLADQLTNAGADLGAQGTKAVLHGGEEGIGRAGIGGERSRGGGGGRGSRRRGNDGRRGRRRDNGDDDSGGGGGGLGGGLLGSGGHVCSIGGVSAGHF